MNFNCYNYNELILYASAFISGNGYIKYDGYILYFRPTKPPNDRRSLEMVFTYEDKQYKQVLSTFTVTNIEHVYLIFSHPHLDKSLNYFFALR